jgi:putative ABC transport system permease protein
MAAIEKIYKEFFPGAVFDWSFVDDTIQQQYTKEKISRNQIILFASLALLIACLGMLGIISYKAAEKTKEIGIRKVLGAQLHQIVQILVSTTFRQILGAAMVGIPVAYYLTQEYLEKFSERIALQWWHFALPVLILVTIMFSTIASVLWRAAKNNPVDALKYE